MSSALSEESEISVKLQDASRLTREVLLLYNVRVKKNECELKSRSKKKRTWDALMTDSEMSILLETSDRLTADAGFLY